jgi:hypothetical protein
MTSNSLLKMSNEILCDEVTDQTVYNSWADCSADGGLFEKQLIVDDSNFFVSLVNIRKSLFLSKYLLVLVRHIGRFRGI